MISGLQGSELFDGRYKIGAVIGSGAYGTVYQATQVELGRRVALKVLPTASWGSEQHTRFVREAHVLSTLKHRNLPIFFGYGDNHGQAYIAMEYVEGRPLSQVLAATPQLEVIRSLMLVRQLASALACAHSYGVIHRDLKPSNLILCAEPGGGELLKVIDFGLSAITAGSDLPRQTITEVGTAVGTVLYMSPEQCCGELVDHRADIYSLGCILYTALCGAPPFASDGVYELMQLQLSAAPVFRLPDSSSHAAIPLLKRLMDGCLAKNKKERFQSAADVISVIDEIVAMKISADQERLIGQSLADGVSHAWHRATASGLVSSKNSHRPGYGSTESARKRLPALFRSRIIRLVAFSIILLLCGLLTAVAFNDWTKHGPVETTDRELSVQALRRADAERSGNQDSLASNDYEKSVLLNETDHALSPGQLLHAYQRGLSALGDVDKERAFQLARKALSNGSLLDHDSEKRSDILFWFFALAPKCHDLRQVEETVSHYTSNDPACLSAVAGEMADLYLHKNMPEKALESLARADSFPSKPEDRLAHWCLRGKAYAQLRRPADVRRCADEVIASKVMPSDKCYTQIHSLLDVVFVVDHREMFPEICGLYEKLSTLGRELSMYKAVRPLLDEAFWVADDYHKFDQARRCVHKAMSISSSEYAEIKYGLCQCSLARLALLQHQEKAYIENYCEGFQAFIASPNHNDPECMDAIGDIGWQMISDASAVKKIPDSVCGQMDKLLGKTIRSVPHHPVRRKRLQFLRGVLAQFANHDKQAMQYFEQVAPSANLDGWESDQIRRAQVAAEVDLGDFIKASTLNNKLMARASTPEDKAIAESLSAWIQLRQGKFDDAMRSINNGLELVRGRPQSVGQYVAARTLWIELAFVTFRLGKRQDVLEHLDSIKNRECIPWSEYLAYHDVQARLHSDLRKVGVSGAWLETSRVTTSGP